MLQASLLWQGIKSLNECIQEQKDEPFETLAHFCGDWGFAPCRFCREDLCSARPALVLRATPPPGSCGRGPVPMGCEVLPPESCDAALGGAWIARDMYNGAEEVMGIWVDEQMGE